MEQSMEYSVAWNSVLCVQKGTSLRFEKMWENINKTSQANNVLINHKKVNL
jgi:hypothetical protein